MITSKDNKYKQLKDYRLPEILLNIGNAGKTGTLHLKNWPAEKILHIKDGNIIFATSNIEDECLGIHLLKKGDLKVVQYYESIRLLETTGKRHGAILVELGFLTKNELETAVKKQVEDIVLNTFKWEYGYFYFEEGYCDISEPVKIATNTFNLIYKGIKGIDSFPQIRNAMPLTTVLALSPASNNILQQLKLNDDEKIIMNRIDGKNTVLEIIKRTGKKDLDTLRVLYALMSLEIAMPVNYAGMNKKTVLSAVIEINSHEELYKRGSEFFTAGQYSEAAKIFREAVNLNPRVADYYYYLGRSLKNTSAFSEAENSLIKAVELEPFNDAYYTELGVVYEKQGFSEKAARTFKFALRINPANENAHRELSGIKK